MGMGIGMGMGIDISDVGREVDDCKLPASDDLVMPFESPVLKHLRLCMLLKRSYFNAFGAPGGLGMYMTTIGICGESVRYEDKVRRKIDILFEYKAESL